MKTTLRILILVLVIITISKEVNANKIYNGYVETLLGETYVGKIEMQTAALNEVRVCFLSKGGKKQLFKAKEVKEYGFEVKKWNNETNQHYIVNVIYVKKKVERAPVAFGTKEVLLEREVEGVINLYHHFIENNANVEQPLEHIIYIERINNELISLTKENYKSILNDLTREYQDLQDQINRERKGFKHLAQIIKYCNEWIMENGEEEVIDF